MPEINSVFFALIGGISPALLWLWFWRREDRAHPEPLHLIALAFLAGMLTVAIVIPVQKYVATFALGTTLTFIAWSCIEEVTKYLSARFTVLKNRAADEPIDMVIYMVAVALGFAAIENALFLLSPLSGSGTWDVVLTGNLRFVGATLLHVLSSAVIGIFLALSFYKTKNIKRIFAFSGVILAAILHSGFNLLILNTSDEHLFRTFSLVWVGVIVVLALLEIIKRIRRRFN
jgi:RsiW-degrading membrane proteinase PrsW (M82 family)